METSPDYDERVINVVTNARELSPERESFLRQRCKTDATLYQEISEALK